MATSFCLWFYAMLNGNSEHWCESKDSHYGPEHFFDDCQLKVVVVDTDSSSRVETYSGAQQVCDRLKLLVTDSGFLFNPNLDGQGYQEQFSVFGLCQIDVCGTLHHKSTFVGVFEQQFGLIRDPLMHNNFRIKFTNLRLKACSVSHVPNVGSVQLALQ